MSLQPEHYPVHQVLDKFFASFVENEKNYRGIVNVPPYFEQNWQQLKKAIIEVFRHEGRQISDRGKVVVTLGEIAADTVEYFSEKIQKKYTLRPSWKISDQALESLDIRAFHK